MQESNIFFVPNTYNYGGIYEGDAINKFVARKGNEEFFRQVKDYGALIKLKANPRMHGTLNAVYYAATKEQLLIVDPQFSSVMLNHREKDPIIEAENAIKDVEYGYQEENDFYPLLEEIVIDDSTVSYADEILGKWMLTEQPLDSKSESPFGLYIKQKIELDESRDVVSAKDAGFEDIEDIDPYYYQYEEVAGKEKRKLGDIDIAKLYEGKYGSIFRIFEEVEQQDIIEAQASQYTFVNAGPGTGKTYTLMNKIIYMVEEEGIDPEKILVLCFTNAAVNEIKARIKKYSEEHGERTFINVDVRTFHSFSWLLISQANEIFYDRSNYHYIDISKLNYDQSIRSATTIIRQFGNEVFGGCSHLIIDEIQDLTNERASLVISMIQECMKNNVGFTVLGDACQAIYDYTDEDTFFEMKSDRFYKHIFSEMFDKGRFYKLEKNCRQNQWLILIGAPLRQAILNGKKDDVRKAIALVRNAVSNYMKGAFSVKASQYEINMLEEQGTVCLMCRNNAQVLATSSNLRKRGIKHIVNAYNEFEYLSEWIAKAFGLFTKEIVTYDEFENLVSVCSLSYEANVIWQRLQELIGSNNNVLKIQDILESVAKSVVDDPIFRNVPQGKIIVSNIHKSKGREYDTVILEQKFINRLINESKSIKSVQEYVQEAKTLYVAITRPRENLYINSLATTDVSLKRISTGRKRWARGDGSNLKVIEVRALTDADVNSFDSVDIQKYIIENVFIGDEIKLVMDNNSRTLVYDIVHTSRNGDRKIGRITNEFIDDVDAIITPYESPWPKYITDLYVSGIHSKISSDYKHTWCWIDFCGLGLCHSESY